jgi:erythromycin esterase-like protein
MSLFSTRNDTLLQGLRTHVRALPSQAADDELLIGQLARCKLALLGEASHGTHEFYAERVATPRSRSKPTGPTPGG